MISSYYDPRLKNVNTRISTGADLLKKEKVASVMRSLPKSILKRVPYDKILEVVGNSVSGTTAEDLRNYEDKRVVDINKALAFSANNRAASISSIYRKRRSVGRGKGQAGFKELKDIAEHEGIYSTGTYDNSDIDDGMKDMINQGYHPAAIATAVSLSIDRDLFGDSFPDPVNQPKLYNNFKKLVISLDKNQQDSSDGGISFGGTNANFGYKPAVRKDLTTLRRENMKVRGSNSTFGVGREFLTPPNSVPVTTTTNSSVPVTTTTNSSVTTPAATSTNKVEDVLPDPVTTKQRNLPAPKDLINTNDYSAVDSTVGAIETARSMLAGAIAEPVAGLFGLGASLFGNAQDGANMVNNVREAFCIW